MSRRDTFSVVLCFKRSVGWSERVDGRVSTRNVRGMIVCVCVHAGGSPMSARFFLAHNSVPPVMAHPHIQTPPANNETNKNKGDRALSGSIDGVVGVLGWEGKSCFLTYLTEKKSSPPQYSE